MEAYGHLFAGGLNEFVQRHGSNLIRVSRCADLVDGMLHTTIRLDARIPTGLGGAEWMGPVVCVSHIDGEEMIYMEDSTDPRVPESLRLDPRDVLVDVLFERDFAHPNKGSEPTS